MRSFYGLASFAALCAWATSVRGQLNDATPYTFTTVTRGSCTTPPLDTYTNGVAVDAAGNHYLKNSGIIKVPASDTASLLAGASGVGRIVDGQGTNAAFAFVNTPGDGGLAVAPNGNVYVMDTTTVRQVTPAGVVASLAGGPNGTFQMYTTGICTDTAGNAYVSNGFAGEWFIKKITPAGVVSGSATGRVLAEPYEATPSALITPATPRLINVSVPLKQIGSSFTVGFVIGGGSARAILARAVGSGLAPLNVAGFVADPKLTLYSGSTAMAENDNWNGTAELTTAFSSVGACSLPPTSLDAAHRTTLPPGPYSLQVAPVGSATGLVLVEVYEAP